ncbi:hypothetical protein DdX_18017 [Ditylenchus destructor]|uniref:Uncharacterized protein n=1 Tax=Ditylenchus destructor TaxID=166010 RepID=A0AAD4QYN3_9BILA|nr:hypothetical protein DdX_18017 [Ditylenchus destructor]
MLLTEYRQGSTNNSNFAQRSLHTHKSKQFIWNWSHSSNLCNLLRDTDSSSPGQFITRDNSSPATIHHLDNSSPATILHP